jgi:translation initiation factor 6
MQNNHILITSIEGNSNIGLYGFANDNFCLLGRNVPEEKAKEIEKILHVPVHQITLAGTSLIGVFCAGNNKGIVIPDIVFDEEQKVLEKLDIPFKVIETKLTALGNNLLCNDHGCLANPEFSAFTKKRIREALQVSLKPGMITDLPTVGACGVVNTKGCMLHRDAADFEIDFVQDLLQVPIETGTINMASPYIKSGVLCNSKGMVVGEQSGGPEINHIDQHLFGEEEKEE